MTTGVPSAALATIQPAFTDAERVALAGFLAGYRGLTREAYALDLRQFGLVLFGLGLLGEEPRVGLGQPLLRLPSSRTALADARCQQAGRTLAGRARWPGRCIRGPGCAL